MITVAEIPSAGDMIDGRERAAAPRSAGRSEPMIMRRVLMHGVITHGVIVRRVRTHGVIMYRESMAGPVDCETILPGATMRVGGVA